MFEYGEIVCPLGQHLIQANNATKEGWELVTVLGPIHIKTSPLAQEAQTGLILILKRVVPNGSNTELVNDKLLVGSGISEAG